MPQESAGCARSRTSAFALLVGLALMLMAHVVTCAVHPAEGHSHAAAPTSSVHAEPGADVLLLASHASDCSATDAHHPGHGAACCDPADWPADVRVPAGALFLALLLLGLLALRHRPEDPAASGAPGRGDFCRPPSLTGLHLLRLVCVSRT